MPSGAHRGRQQYYIITIISWLYNHSSFWLYHMFWSIKTNTIKPIYNHTRDIEANSRTHSLFALRIFCGWYYTNNVNDGVCSDDEIAENVKKKKWKVGRSLLLEEYFSLIDLWFVAVFPQNWSRSFLWEKTEDWILIYSQPLHSFLYFLKTCPILTSM